MSISHVCIKCKASYSDEETDDYYCETCRQSKEKIAKEVDAKIAMRGPSRQAKSDYQIYEELRKAKGTQFVSINDLGIKL